MPSTNYSIDLSAGFIINSKIRNNNVYHLAIHWD